MAIPAIINIVATNQYKPLMSVPFMRTDHHLLLKFIARTR